MLKHVLCRIIILAHLVTYFITLTDKSFSTMFFSKHIFISVFSKNKQHISSEKCIWKRRASKSYYIF